MHEDLSDFMKLFALKVLWLIAALSAWGAYKLFLWVKVLPPEAIFLAACTFGVMVIAVLVWSIVIDFRSEAERMAAIRCRNQAERLRRQNSAASLC